MSWLFGLNQNQQIPKAFEEMIPPPGSGGRG